ncbi:MAG: peptidoglycan-binding protein [Planctomycetes bacterium]|nr:peptidoglycan-binding protein [Planctomycetota bacterium]
MRPPRAYSFRLNLPHAPRRAAGAAALLFALLACALPFALARAAVAAPPADYAALEPVRAGALYLRLGASGTRVLALQHALAAAGESTPVNSAFDTATWLAVRRFQGAAAVGVDGVVGPRTIGALDRVLG